MPEKKAPKEFGRLRSIRTYRNGSDEIIGTYVGDKGHDILVVPLSGAAEPYAIANYGSLIGEGAEARLGFICLENSHARITKVAGVYPPEKSLEPDRRYQLICVDHERREPVLATLKRIVAELKEKEPITGALYIAVRDLFNTTIDD